MAPQAASARLMAGRDPSAANPLANSDRTPPPPPYRGGPTSAQGVATPTITDAGSPREIGVRLLAQTEAALSRHTLLQVASLPDQADLGPHHGDAQAPHWNFEIPFVTMHGTTIAQFEVSRDGRSETGEGRTTWRARFSLNIEPVGPVHVQIALFGERAAITLWAEREGSAARLRDCGATLAKALREAEIEPGDIQFRSGAPAMPKPPAGQFLDRAS